MKKPLSILAALAYLNLLPSNASARCWSEGVPAIDGHPQFQVETCKNCASEGHEPFVSTEKPETRTLLGSDFASEIGAIHNGELLSYAGPANPGSAVNIGAPLDIPGSKTAAESTIAVSINWRPVMQEYCSKHKTVFSKGRKCVEKKGFALPTSFVVEVVNNNGFQSRHTFKNVHNLSNAIITIPKVVCEGAMSGYEARIRDLSGGSVDFTIHKITTTKHYQY